MQTTERTGPDMEAIDRLLRAGRTNEEICEALGIPSRDALYKQIQRERKAIRRISERRQLVDREEEPV